MNYAELSRGAELSRNRRYRETPRLSLRDPVVSSTRVVLHCSRLADRPRSNRPEKASFVTSSSRKGIRRQVKSHREMFTENEAGTGHSRHFANHRREFTSLPYPHGYQTRRACPRRCLFSRNANRAQIHGPRRPRDVKSTRVIRPRKTRRPAAIALRTTITRTLARAARPRSLRCIQKALDAEKHSPSGRSSVHRKTENTQHAEKKYSDRIFLILLPPPACPESVLAIPFRSALCFADPSTCKWNRLTIIYT